MTWMHVVMVLIGAGLAERNHEQTALVVVAGAFGHASTAARSQNGRQSDASKGGA